MVVQHSATLAEGTMLVLTSSQLSATDADSDVARLLFLLASLPAHGQLMRDGSVLGVPDSFSQEDVTAGRIRYAHDGSETAHDSFEFTVQDPAGNEAASAMFLIAVTPVNDAPTELALSHDRVAENASSAGGPVFVGHLQAVDPDPGETFSFALVSGAGTTDNGRFEVVGNALQVKQGVTLDYETQATYSLRVEVRDSGGLRLEKILTVRVEDRVEVLSVVVGDGSSSRSMVTELKVTFDRLVDVRCRGLPAGAEGITGQSAERLGDGRERGGPDSRHPAVPGRWGRACARAR